MMPSSSAARKPRDLYPAGVVVRRSVHIILCILSCSFGGAVASAGQQSAAPGRVVATVSTLEGTVQMPGVQVDLRAASDPTVMASTTTDGSGRVAFPDVPPGRYLITATRAGFLPADSTPFEVRPGETAEVLLDIQ